MQTERQSLTLLFMYLKIRKVGSKLPCSYLIKHYTMKTSFTSQLLYPPSIQPQVAIVWEVGWSPESIYPSV